MIIDPRTPERYYRTIRNGLGIATEKFGVYSLFGGDVDGVAGEEGAQPAGGVGRAVGVIGDSSSVGGVRVGREVTPLGL